MKPTPPVTRRTFIVDFATASAAVALAPRLTGATASAPTPAAPFRSAWTTSPDRIWAGPEYWANPLQDWRVANGRLENIRAGSGREVHLLTRELGAHAGTFQLRVRLGLLGERALASGAGAAGFSVGVRGSLPDYRHHLVFGQGLNCGLRAKGELFIGNNDQMRTAPCPLGDLRAVDLVLSAEPRGAGYLVALEAREPGTDRSLGRVEHDAIPAARLVGNLTLAANFGPRTQVATDTDRWWFADWQVEGSKTVAHDDRAFGPLWFNQYAMHARTLKMSVQMPPIGERDDQTVRLQFRAGNAWQTRAEATIEAASRTALFRIGDWDDTRDTPYRLAYTLRRADGAGTEHFLEGTIRRDPVDRDVLTVADISCNAHFAFPNNACAESIAKLDPDLLAFTGDQYYESTGAYGVDRRGGDWSALDVLRKWAQHGWTWREVLRDRPSITIPDDHDVYHGNLWGEGGVAAPGHDGPAESKGGYKMTADFVNTVHRMQTAHHPDSPAQPGAQGITGYYGPLTYGRVSFAILADRQYKSAPDGKVPPTTSGRADHVVDPNFDPKSADLPGLSLLGDEQETFLRTWTRDWKGADLKAVISQTIFTAMATHHGPRADRLVADYDTNAWPQTARNRALREMRRVFAFHLAGDQHLPAVVHYGIDEHRDAGIAFASPAVNNLYARRFRPDGVDRSSGDYRDSFGHPLTVLAAANPATEYRRGVLEAEVDKSAGFGVVRFNRHAGTVTIECWPLLAEPLAPASQFPGWPLTVSLLDNYARKPAGHLPPLRNSGSIRPLIEVIEDATRETLYLIRLPANDWRPPVFASGTHTLRVSDPDTGAERVFNGLQASEGAAPLDVRLL